MPHKTDFRVLATQLVEAQRLESRVVLGDAIDTLKGNAVGRGRLASGFFVEDLVKLCERHLQRRGSEIVAAYESALRSCRPPMTNEVESSVREGVREQLHSEASEIEAAFQRGALRDHLPVFNPLANATFRVEMELDARVRLLLAGFAGAPADFVAAPPAVLPRSGEDIIEIRPNFAGLGINLRALSRKVTSWWSDRRESKSP